MGRRRNPPGTGRKYRTVHPKYSERVRGGMKTQYECGSCGFVGWSRLRIPRCGECDRFLRGLKGRE